MTNQLIVKMVLDAWNQQVQIANKLFDSLTDEQLLQEVAPNRNRGVYLLGHLTAVNDRMLPLLGFGVQSFPQLDEPFLTKPDKEVAEIPTAGELRIYLKESVEALAKNFAALSVDEWFEKHNSVSAEDFAKEPHRNKLNVIIGRTNHLANHLGQLVFLKK